MCTRPIQKDGNEFACRTCNECIAKRRIQWVARAMMEKTLWPEAVCLTLTYDDSTTANRDAAAMFQYADVRAFLARLREAVKAKRPGASIRFLIAGEQGDRNGRCHWHCIIYSDVKIWQLGAISGFMGARNGYVKLSEWQEIMSTGKKKVRCNWSLWPHGFVSFQEPDLGGMHYVLSYCLKDQFTPQKSKDTGREGKTDNFATGLFRMSKRPPIGEGWLYQKFARLDDLGAVLPSLEMTVPGMKGSYYPAGSFREKTLWAMVALNQRAIWATGRNAPQWSSLVHSCAEIETDLEVLLVKKNEEELEWRRRVNAIVAEGEARKRVAACGAKLPCTHCLNRLAPKDLETLGLFRFVDEEGVARFGTFDTRRHVEHEQSIAGQGVNPYCFRAGSDEVLNAFTRVYGGAERASGRSDLQGKA